MTERKATHISAENHERLRALQFKRRLQIQRMIDVAITEWLDGAEKEGEQWWASRFTEIAQAGDA